MGRRGQEEEVDRRQEIKKRIMECWNGGSMEEWGKKKTAGFAWSYAVPRKTPVE